MSVKFYIIFILLLFLKGIEGNAQSNIAFRGGLDIIPTSSNDQTHDGNLPKGFHAGLMGNLPISSKISLQPGIQFTWMTYYSRTNVPEDQFVEGIAEEFQLPPDQARQLISVYRQKTEKTTSYIFFPVLLKYRFSPSWRLLGGPQLGLIFHNKDLNNLNATVAGQPIQNSTEITSTDGLRETQFALSTGMEYKLSDITGLEFRYVRSLNSLEDSGSTTNSYYNFVQLSMIVFVL